MTIDSGATQKQWDESTAGVVTTSDDQSLLRFQRKFPVAPAHVWAAITQRDLMGKWAFPGDIEPTTGGAVRFDPAAPSSEDGRVLAWSPDRVLQYRWGSPEDAWEIRFELTPVEGGTTMVFTHLFPDPSDPQFAAGWHWHLDRLGQLLDGVEPADVDEDQHFQDLLKRYAD